MIARDKYFRKKLSHAFKEGMLNEGLFDDILNFLGNLENKWSSARSNSQDASLPNVPDRLDPGKSPQGRLHAIICVCQAVGYCVEAVIRDAEFAKEQIEQIMSSDEEVEMFDLAKETLGNITNAVGAASGWLQNDTLKDCSGKIYAVGSSIEPGESVSESIKSLSDALKDIRNFDIDGEIKNSLSDEAVKKLLEEDPYFSDRGRDFIDEGLDLIDSLPEAISVLDDLETQAASLEALLDEKTDEGEIISTGEVSHSDVFESVLFNVYKEVLKESTNGS